MSAANFHMRASAVQQQHAQGFIGQVIGTFESLLLTNKNPQAKQVSTITVGGATNDTVYTVTVGGSASTYTSDASATAAEIHAGLVAAINANPVARGQMVASGTSPSLVLTGVYPGQAITVTVNDAGTGDLGTVAATTAAATADSVGFGKAMVNNGYTADRPDMIGHVPSTADFTAQVITYTYTGVTTGDEVSLEVLFQGQRFVETTTYATSQTATLAALVTAMDVILDAAFGAGLSILLASNATTITLTSDIAGSKFDAVSAVDGTGTVVKAYTTPPSAATSLEEIFAGFSKRRTDIEDATLAGDDPAYPANIGVETVTRGLGYVSNSQGVTFGQNVYVDLGAASATKGDFFNSAAAGRVWLPVSKARWERDEYSTSSNDVAVLRVESGRVG